jgi:hypothetical protein
VWVYGGRTVVVVETTSKGPVVTRRGDPDRVPGPQREAAAAWLGEFFPRLTHDERFALLWRPT